MPRGSLLAWIDDYLVIERDLLDRTVGRFENLMHFPYEQPIQIRPQINIITFPATGFACPDNDYINCNVPQTHPDTFMIKIWNPDSYCK